MIRKIKSAVKKLIMLTEYKEKFPVVSFIPKEKLLYGKVAVITGGSGGIGFAIAKKLLDYGCKVIITGTNQEKLERSVSELCVQYKEEFLNSLILNLNEVESFVDFPRKCCEIFGKVDILVHSAGVFSTKNDFLHVEEEEYDIMMNTNLKGAYFICQSFANYFVREKIKGHICVVSSQSALEPAWSPYRLSKCALAGLIKGIAQQLIQYGIVVNGIGPGPTATGMQNYKDGESIKSNGNPLGRLAMPEEIAVYTAFLVSSLGNMVVGDTLYLSGGRGIFDVR